MRQNANDAAHFRTRAAKTRKVTPRNCSISELHRRDGSLARPALYCAHLPHRARHTAGNSEGRQYLFHFWTSVRAGLLNSDDFGGSSGRPRVFALCAESSFEIGARFCSNTRTGVRYPPQYGVVPLEMGMESLSRSLDVVAGLKAVRQRE